MIATIKKRFLQKSRYFTQSSGDFMLLAAMSEINLLEFEDYLSNFQKRNVPAFDIDLKALDGFSLRKDGA